MITDLLNTNEKKALIVLLKKVISANGKIVNNEKIFFDSFKQMLSLKGSKLNYNESTINLCNKFKSHNSKVVCLLEMIGIAWVDNDFQKEEKLFIEEVCKFFNFNKSVIKTYSKWSKDMANLQLQLYKYLKFN